MSYAQNSVNFYLKKKKMGQKKKACKIIMFLVEYFFFLYIQASVDIICWRAYFKL